MILHCFWNRWCNQNYKISFDDHDDDVVGNSEYFAQKYTRVDNPYIVWYYPNTYDLVIGAIRIKKKEKKRKEKKERKKERSCVSKLVTRFFFSWFCFVLFFFLFLFFFFSFFLFVFCFVLFCFFSFPFPFFFFCQQKCQVWVGHNFCPVWNVGT